MSRRYSEPIRNHKLTEHRRHTANHPVFFKKRKTSTQKRIQVIYKDAQDSPETTLKKRNLQNKRNRTKRASMLVAATLAGVALSSLFTKKGGRK